jgi:hypothetical protein
MLTKRPIHARVTGCACILAALLAAPTLRSGVVINEIFYNAPDDIDDLQWIELHNDGDDAVDLGGWTLDGGSVFVFPPDTRLAAQEHLVAALDPARFASVHGSQAIGPLKRPLKRGGERIVLADAAGRRIDAARYEDEDPWPVSADGCTASIERICPSFSGEAPENWVGSPLSAVEAKSGGTPGRRNAGHAAVLPPVIRSTSEAPDDLAPGETLRVEADVVGEGLRQVSLLYRVVAEGAAGEEVAIPMVRSGATVRYHAEIPGQKSGLLVRYRIQAMTQGGARRSLPAEHDLRPTFSTYVHDKWTTAKIPFGLILRGGADRRQTEPPRAESRRRFGRGPAPNFSGFGPSTPDEPRSPRGASAFVHVDAATGKTKLFDHIHIVGRDNDRGFKIFFHKDRTFEGIRSLNVIFEGSEWSLLAEALAFDLYRRAGIPAPLTWFVRIWVDGRMVGYHLAVERVNASFLRRNDVAGGGHLYKIRWMGRDVVGRHEKRSRKHEGHDDLLATIDKLAETSGDEQWKAIQEEFNVDEVATYFAVNMALSHWDGFFNNYFPYHDTKNGKWEMYPWDQDKTWGYYDGLPDDQVFVDMPLTSGMAGDRPPRVDGGGGPFGRRGPMWWREGGDFSRPLLANPRFRKAFLARAKEILEKLYTAEVYFPLMDGMAASLEEDVKLRAEASGRAPEDGARELARNVELLKTHLIQRRRFLLEQDEIRKLDPKTQAAAPAGR